MTLAVTSPGYSVSTKGGPTVVLLAALTSTEVLTSLRVKNFKSLEDVEIELGNTVVFIGPNNSGKTTALQALAVWEIGLRKWLEKRAARGTPAKRPGVTINRRDLIAVPVPDANLLWRDLHVRAGQKHNGKPTTQNIRIDISVSGVTEGSAWECGFEFDYANQESFYCRPLRGIEEAQADQPVAAAAAATRIAFLPPMSGLAATEDHLQEGAISVRIGEGRTAEVLRNLCHRIHSDADKSKWQRLVSEIESLFGVTLNPPLYITERGQITMSYRERGIELDLVSSGRGLQQTLLLLAHLYAHPGDVLLLDEPDAHLEILRQRQIYQILTETARSQGCQVIAASHSEILLNEAADRDIVIAFIGKPHRIDDRGSQLAKSLKAIGFEHYAQAEQMGWVLYLEGSTDLAILQAFADMLSHPAGELLKKTFVHYVGNVPSKARDHFFGLQEAKPDLVGISIYDADATPSTNEGDGPLRERKWRQREIENYLCSEGTLRAYAGHIDGDPNSLFGHDLRNRQTEAMQSAIDQVSNALKILNKPDPFGPDVKASDDFLVPVFRKYFEKLALPNQMQKTDFHVLTRFVPHEEIDREITEKLDQILITANRAKPY